MHQLGRTSQHPDASAHLGPLTPLLYVRTWEYACVRGMRPGLLFPPPEGGELRPPSEDRVTVLFGDSGSLFPCTRTTDFPPEVCHPLEKSLFIVVHLNSGRYSTLHKACRLLSFSTIITCKTLARDLWLRASPRGKSSAILPRGPRATRGGLDWGMLAISSLILCVRVAMLTSSFSFVLISAELPENLQSRFPPCQNLEQYNPRIT